MRMLTGVVLGPRTIEADTDVKGMIIGMATVRPGVELIVRGVVTGDIVLEPGSRLSVDGDVLGTIYDQGGTVDVRGRIARVEQQSQFALVGPVNQDAATAA